VDARLAKNTPGRNARFAGKEPGLGTGNEDRVDKSGLSERSTEEQEAGTSKDEFVGLFG